MFRTFARKFLPNRLDWILRRAAKKRARRVLICWNGGLGDIPLGVFAVIHRTRELIPGSKITVLTRESLRDGFRLVPDIEVLVEPSWLRDGIQDFTKIDRKQYDLVIEKPMPNNWCRWQWNALTPRLRWSQDLERSVDLPKGFTYIGVQVSAENNNGFWRNWSKERWDELFDRLEKMGYVRVLLFGYGTQPVFKHKNIIDFRGKTSLYELLSIIKNFCAALVLPDSGILSMAYYLDVSFPIHVVSLFADPGHGILKQGVASPNLQLRHTTILSELRNLSSVSATQVFDALFPKKTFKPLLYAPHADGVVPALIERVACLILAGGQGSRLGWDGPKGLYEVLGKSLFAHAIEKIPSSIPLLVMTSPLNHADTVAFFQLNGWKAKFFQQKMINLLDADYEPVGFGPDGNGGLYKQLLASGLLDELEQAGIDTILIAPVDNPLADPVDAKLLAIHRQLDADVTIKCVERVKGESMGALSTEGIVEYFAITEDIYSFSYVGQAAVSTRFVRQAAKLDLPYHWVKKNGLWKRERLLFDAFHVARKIGALCYPRHLCYGPIKGPESKVITEKLLSEKR